MFYIDIKPFSYCKKMYNTKYVCSYMDSDVFLDEDMINEQEKDFIRNCIYRQDFLNIFVLEEYIDTLVNKELITIYKTIHTNEHFQNVINRIINKYEVNYDGDDGDDGDGGDGDNNVIAAIMLLYSFDYMYLFHDCYCDFLSNNQTMNKETIDKLEQIK